MTAKTIALVACFLLLPTATAQSQAQAFVALPHGIDLKAGANHIETRVVASLQCNPGQAAPAPLHVLVMSGAQGPDDGSGPAWTLPQASWELAWTSRANNTFEIDTTITINVTANGYGTTGYAGEIAVGAKATSGAGCTPGGYAVPARSNHAHMQVGARQASQDAAAPATLLIGLGLLALAARRR